MLKHLETKLEYYLQNDEAFVSYDRIGIILKETVHCIMDQHHKFNLGYNPNGHSPSLTADQIKEISNYIKEEQLQNNYQIFPTYYDIDDFARKKFNKNIYKSILSGI